MNIKKGQLYIVTENFRELGATLYKNQTFKIINIINKKTILVAMIATVVKACPKGEASPMRWSLNSKIITKYCEIILRPEDPEAKMKETLVKAPIKRYNKKEFKTILKSVK